MWWWQKNHAIYQNDKQSSLEKEEVEPVELVHMSICQGNTYRKELSWLHFDDESMECHLLSPSPYGIFIIYIYNMRICIYCIHTYVCIYMHVCVCVWVCLCIYIYIYIYIIIIIGNYSKKQLGPFSPDMTTVFHAWLYGRFIEIQSNLSKKKLHRTNQGSNFLGGSLSNRMNVMNVRM